MTRAATAARPRLAPAARAVAASLVALVAWGASLAAADAPPAAPATPGAAPTAPAAPRDAATLQEERWYRMALDGRPCGWVHERVERAGELVRSVSRTELTIGRMGQQVVLKTEIVVEENARGQVSRVVVTKESGTAPVRSTWLFGPGGIDVVEEQGGRTNARRYPALPADCLSPRAVDEFVRRRLASGATELAYSTMSPESGPSAVRVESRRTGTGTATVQGREVPVTEWSTRSSLLERPSTEVLSGDGVLVRSRTDIGVGVLESTLSTKEAATAANGGVELMARTFVPVTGDPRRIPGSHRVELRVRGTRGPVVELPGEGAQRVERQSPELLRVTVDETATTPATAGELKDERFRRASVMVDCDDPKVKALATQALRGVAAKPMEQALALRSAVARHIVRKDLASGFGTASDAAASRAGDCTEHAVLLAAVLRSAGIPSRVVTGLLFVPAMGSARNVYGWHMWTQAIIDGQWTDFDAVLPPGPRRFDASHLMTGSSAADAAGLDADLVRIVDLIGAMGIEIFSVDGAPAAPAAPAGAAP